jgi:hypothetical protein
MLRTMICQLGKVISVNDRFIEISFEPKYHVPPPSFGSFIKIENAANIWYGLIYNAEMIPDKVIEKPVSKDQAPDHSDYNHYRLNHLFKTNLQILLIGQNIGKHFSVHLQSLPVQFYNAFYVDEHELKNIVLDLDFITAITSCDDPRIPAEKLIRTVLRRLMSITPDLLSAHTRNTIKQLQSDKHFTIDNFYNYFIQRDSGENT